MLLMVVMVMVVMVAPIAGKYLHSIMRKVMMVNHKR